MKNIKNLKILALSLCMGATLLTGCGSVNKNKESKIILDDSSLTYDIDENQVSGNITFEDLIVHGRVVVLKDDDKTFGRFLLKKHKVHKALDGVISSENIDYIDVETGATLISYVVDSSNEKKYEIGENLEIISENAITSYLLNNDFVKISYTIEELLNYFDESILPTLDINEKELIK